MMSSGGACCGPDKTYKLLMLGEGGVGKTALVMQYVFHTFEERHMSTIEDVVRHQTDVGGRTVSLEILDTGSEPCFVAANHPRMFREADGFILCFDLTDRYSLEVAVMLRKLIDRICLGEDVSVVLVGTKRDLEHKRKVSHGDEEGETLAKDWDCRYIETSAKKNEKVDEVFRTIIADVLNRPNCPRCRS